MEIVLHSTKNITRIVSDRNCLGYFVQYLEQKSALPLIRFWLDVESFKSSAEQCSSQRKYGNKRVATKSAIGRSVSLDGMALNRDDFYSAYNDEIDERNETNLNELPSERDNGDGSSDANSMTNLSDIYERNDDDQLESLSMDDDAGAQKILENGRKSATGASSHGDETESEKPGATPKTPSASAAASLTVDAIRIFKKYLLAGELTSLVRIPTNILSQISLALCVQNDDTSKSIDETDKHSKLSISSESIPLSTSTQIEEKNLVTVFDEVQAFILDYLDKMYTSDFLESAFYYRFCIENTGTNLKVTDILYNELALFYFMEFLEVENKRQYLDFWLAAMNFKRQLDTSNTFDDIDKESMDDVNEYNTMEQSQNDALILYEKYFSLQATCPLHLSDRVRFRVEEKICSIDDNEPIVHCFDLPLAIIERFLSEKFLKPFERSPLFYKYLAELTQKMEAMSTKTTPKTINATSDTSETHNNRKSTQKDYAQKISAKNTLLAMESVKKRTHQRIKSSDMCIDSRQLHDPDLLWRRNSIGGALKFGHVNEMGRYERDYDMTPCDKTNFHVSNGSGNIDANQIIQNTGNKIKRAVRKLVHLPEQCMQEEIAWQMAEMIVKDITSITLQTNQVPRETC